MRTSSERTREWWEKKSARLVCIDTPTYLAHDVPDDLKNLYSRAQNYLHASITQRFDNRERFLAGAQLPVSDQPIVINPVYLNLSRQLFDRMLRTPNEEAARKLFLENLPEAQMPLSVTIGTQYSGKGKGINSTFLNAFYVNAEDFPLDSDSIPYEYLTAFFQSMKAKGGTTKELWVLCDRQQPSGISSVILSTLENGHPRFEPGDFNELVRRIRVFANGTPVNVEFPPSSQNITDEQWTHSDGVRYLQTLGKLAGNHRLISAPVIVHELVQNPRLATAIRIAARFSRQQESAMYVYDPHLQVAVVSGSGTSLQSLKTDLKPGDMKAADIRDNPVEDVVISMSQNVRYSVEGKEFLEPQAKLAEKYNIRPVRGVWRPPIIGIFHAHLGVDNKTLPSDVLYIPQDVSVYPPTGCGLDLTDYVSEVMMSQVIEETHNEQYAYAIGESANHGVQVYIPYTVWDNRPMFDPFKRFREDIRSGKYQFTRRIAQK